ncbi:hypothetical protein ACFWUW_18080 [Streptomyces sp. NPDC058655]|uniref:hypothetical protein n=1 Tax=Streptomyces sp. NPDC058655 TaxID=3346577 RepID=UPI0036495D4E
MTGDHLTIDVLRYPDSRGVRAILMAPNPSVHPSGDQLLTHWELLVLLYCELLVLLAA